MMFRKPQVETPEDVARTPDSLLLRKSPTAAPREATVVRASEAGSSKLPEVSVIRSQIDDPATKRSALAPPDLNPNFSQPLMPPRPISMNASKPVKPERLPETGSSSDEVDNSPQIRVRVVVDGDSLRSLAKRYLGSSDRYLEIYEANRDVLKSPELLEIGMRLKIPSAVPPAAPASKQPERKMVPIHR